jgi:CHAT domain-containing protein
VRDILEERFHLDTSTTRLVTLSACESHLGGFDPGAVYSSLSRAFIKAGVPAVVASLWKVDDDATRVLMDIFYRELAKGSSCAEALRQAQRTMRARPEYAQPFFWAPFVLMGDWR